MKIKINKNTKLTARTPESAMTTEVVPANATKANSKINILCPLSVDNII